MFPWSNSLPPLFLVCSHTPFFSVFLFLPAANTTAPTPTRLALQLMTGQACPWMKKRPRLCDHICVVAHSILFVALLVASRTLLFSNTILITGPCITFVCELSQVDGPKSSSRFANSIEYAVRIQLYWSVFISTRIFGTCTYYANSSTTRYCYCIKEASCPHSPDLIHQVYIIVRDVGSVLFTTLRCYQRRGNFPNRHVNKIALEG